MGYVVTFYTIDPRGREATVTEHRIPSAFLDAYTVAPGTTLAAIRLAEPACRIDAFRVTDEDGRLVMQHSDDRQA